MPQRTNTFQEVVALVQRHMAGDATVEEQAMVLPIRGGEPREVDVLITAVAGGHVVRVGVEASKTKRKAGVEWVERMIGKHQDLPTDKVVLYSGSGFTGGAKAKADEHNIAIVAPEHPSEEEIESHVLGGLRSVWPKLVHLGPRAAKVWVRRPDGSIQRFTAPLDLQIFSRSGTSVGNLLKVVSDELSLRMRDVIDQLGVRDIVESTDAPFTVGLGYPALPAGSGGECFARWEGDGTAPVEFHRIEVIEVTGDARVEVEQVNLEHAKLWQRASGLRHPHPYGPAWRARCFECVGEAGNQPPLWPGAELARRQQGRNPACGFCLHPGRHMLIEILGDPRRGVSKDFGHDLRRDPIEQRKCGPGVTEAVERDPTELTCFHEFVECSAYRRRVQRRPVYSREHKVEC